VSLSLYHWRVYWDGRHGGIVRAGIITALTAAPVIPGIGRVEGVDYAPSTVTLVRHNDTEGWQEMRGFEIVAMQAFLMGEG